MYQMYSGFQNLSYACIQGVIVSCRLFYGLSHGKDCTMRAQKRNRKESYGLVPSIEIHILCFMGYHWCHTQRTVFFAVTGKCGNNEESSNTTQGSMMKYLV